MYVFKTKRGHRKVIKMFCSFLIKGKIFDPLIKE